MFSRRGEKILDGVAFIHFHLNIATKTRPSLVRVLKAPARISLSRHRRSDPEIPHSVSHRDEIPFLDRLLHHGQVQPPKESRGVGPPGPPRVEVRGAALPPEVVGAAGVLPGAANGSSRRGRRARQGGENTARGTSQRRDGGEDAPADRRGRDEVTRREEGGDERGDDRRRRGGGWRRPFRRSCVDIGFARHSRVPSSA